MTSEIDRIGRGLKHIAEHDMIEGFRLNPAAFEGGLCGDCTKIGRGKVLQDAAERTEAGACAGNKDDLAI
jgi:hypothetical protein